MFKPRLTLCLLAGLFAGAADAQEALVVNYDEGLRFTWAGGEVGLEGLFEVGARLDVDGDRSPESDFYVKRFRPEFFGSFEGGWRFRFEPKFTEDEVELEEAWVGREFGAGLLRLGRMKAPFGLEETRSRRHIHFPRFSILNQFSPAEDHGIFFAGQQGAFEYGTALLSGSGGSDKDDGKDIALRGMWHFGDLETSGARHWQIGLAGTLGDQDFSIATDGIKNAAGDQVLEYAPGVNLDGTRSRLGLEFAVTDGPWMLQAEVLEQSQEITNGATSATANIQGAYIDLAYALTGEDLTFSGVQDPNNSWVTSLRLSTLDLSDELTNPTFVLPTMAPDRINSITLGLNHIPGPHTIWRLALANSFYADPITLGSKTTTQESTLTLELQLHF